jgi:hypothetical protein
MLRHVHIASILTLVLLASSLSCLAKPVPEATEPLDGLVAMPPPPYRIALASSREAVGLSGFPDGMVVAVELESGRLASSNPAWKALMELADDETVRAIVVAEAPQGTSALFTDLKERRPELLLVALLPQEAPLVIQSVADSVLDFDHVLRAYTTVLMAARLGRSQIVALSLPGTSDDWRQTTRLAVLREASADMGLAFRTLAVAPDGLEKALDGFGIKAGINSGTEAGTGPGEGSAAGSAIVVNDGRMALEALRIANASGALFIELDRPIGGYSGDASPVITSEGLANAPVGGDPVWAMIDSARNVPGRPGLTLVWPGELAPVLELGALVFTKSILDGKSASETNLAAAMNGVWPTGQWHASHFVDSQTGVRARNHLVAGSDPYLSGRSYLSSESRHMPMKYRLANGR